MRPGCAAAAIAVIVGGLTQPARAHPAISASAVVKVDRTGAITVVIIHDALAFALNDTPRNIGDGPMLALLDGPDENMTEAFADARKRFNTHFELLVDSRRLDVGIVGFPTTVAVRSWQREHP